MLLVDDWCAASGLDRAVAERLLLTGAADGIFSVEMKPKGFYYDALPTRERLEAMGLAVRPGYDPDELRSHSYTDDDDLAEADDVDDDDDDDDEGSGSEFTTWSFSIEDHPA